MFVGSTCFWKKQDRDGLGLCQMQKVRTDRLPVNLCRRILMDASAALFQHREQPPHVAGKNTYNPCCWQQGTEYIDSAQKAHGDWRGGGVAAGWYSQLNNGSGYQRKLPIFRWQASSVRKKSRLCPPIQGSPRQRMIAGEEENHEKGISGIWLHWRVEMDVESWTELILKNI